MKIQLKTANSEKKYGNISLDKNGNVYLDTKDKSYQLCIDNKNNPYFDEGDYHILTKVEDDVYGKIYDDVFSEKDNYNEEDDEKNKYKDIDSDEEDYANEEHDPYGYVNDKYYYEEQGSYYSVPTENYNQNKFYFCNTLYSSKDIDVNDRYNGEVLSMYDTFIFQNDQNTFRSKLIGEPPLYVVKMYDNGNITCREICDKYTEKVYSIGYNEKNNLTLFG